MGYSTKSCRFKPARSSYVNIGNYHAFERTDSFSVSIWAKWTASGGLSLNMIGKMSDPPDYRGWLLRAIATGEIQAYIINDNAANNKIQTQVTSTSFKDGAWHHIVMTYDGSSTAAGLKVYVDGVIPAFTNPYDALTATVVTTDPLYIGARKSLANETYWDGNLDEAAIYNKALSAAEVTEIYNQGTTNDLSLLSSAANLVGWWRMGDGDTYPTLTDHGSGAHNGTMTNMLAADIQTDAPFSRFMTLNHTNWRFKANLIQPYSRKCLVYTGASSLYVSLGNVLGFERTDTRSISFWAKWSSATSMQFVAKTDAATTYRGFQVNTNNTGHVEFYLFNDFGGTNFLGIQTNSAFNNGVWHHICVTYDGSSTVAGSKIYVDGAVQVVTTVSNTLSATIITTAELEFAGRATSISHQYLTGSMDEVSIYDSTLSAAQVTALYNGKAPTNLLKTSTVSASGLLGWWRMGDGDTAPTLTDNSTGGHNGTMVNSPVITADWPTTGSYPTDYAIVWRNIKNALIDGTGWTDSTGAAATLSTPWTVVASSNGTVANTSDNWNTNADMVWANAGTAHSWIVLRQTGLIAGQNFEICFDFKDTAQYDMSVAVSFGQGFNVSSPVTTVRPTAPDELFWLSNQNWFMSSNAFNTVLNFQVTDDGQCTRFWGLVAGAAKMFWALDRPKNTVTGWTDPVFLAMASATGILCTSFNDNAYACSRINGINVPLYISADFYNGMAVIQAQTTVNSISSEWPIIRAGIVCTQTGRYGRHGELSDMWWTSTTPAVADTFPASGTLKQFIVIPNMVIPWNRSTPVTT